MARKNPGTFELIATGEGDGSFSVRAGWGCLLVILGWLGAGVAAVVWAFAKLVS